MSAGKRLTGFHRETAEMETSRSPKESIWRRTGLILSPLPNHRAKLLSVGVMNDDGSIDGESNPAVVYAVSPLPVLRKLRHFGGEGVAIKVGGKYRWTSFQLGGRKIVPTGDVEPDGIIHWRDYCYERGISARSLQGMGFYLMRSTLAGRMNLDEGVTMPLNAFPASAHLYAKEGVYENLYQSDIRAAYLSALVSFSPARSYVRVKRISLREACTYGPAAFFLCSYRVGGRSDSSRFGALAENGAVVRRWGKNRLITANDLRVIAALGWSIRILEAWIPNETYPAPFSEFGAEIASIRNDPIMGKVAKLASNTVWGSFSAGSGVVRVSFPGNQRQPKTTALPMREKLCQPLSFSVISSLRERVMVEGMGESTVQAHTDGIISSFPLSTGENLGDWRTIGRFDRVVVVRPSCYALTVDGVTTYKVSGRSGNDEVTKGLFRERLMRYGRDGSSS